MNKDCRQQSRTVGKEEGEKNKDNKSADWENKKKNNPVEQNRHSRREQDQGRNKGRDRWRELLVQADIG